MTPGQPQTRRSPSVSIARAGSSVPRPSAWRWLWALWSFPGLSSSRNWVWAWRSQ